LAVIWEPDGRPGSWKLALPLGELEGHNNSWATGINNAGHVVGQSRVFFEHGHAVMWIFDDDTGLYDIVDLTLNDENHAGTAEFVTEPLNGTVQVFGSSTFDGQSRPTVWTVHIATGTVLTNLTKRAPEGGSVEDIYAGEEVLLRSGVWNLADKVVHELPISGSGCGVVSARAFDSSGKIFGTAEFSNTRKTTCRYNSKDVIDLPVVWTKIVP